MGPCKPRIIIGEATRYKEQGKRDGVGADYVTEMGRRNKAEERRGSEAGQGEGG